MTSFHGLELFYGCPLNLLLSDLQQFMRNTEDCAVYAGTILNARGKYLPIPAMKKLQEALAVMGMLLYWTDTRKENYMKGYPYLLGQLLKVSDCLHELYCQTERKGQIPSQFAGGSLYSTAAELPNQCINQLARRVLPYLVWAKSHQNVRMPAKSQDGKEGPTAAYYLGIYRSIADQLSSVLTDQLRFSEKEKAQLFIGYLASFPKFRENAHQEPDTNNEITGGES